jgi:phosphoglycolate phosphatase-like HAD superfamily hydrolase
VRRLLLWDIDGTLIDCAGVSHHAFDLALSDEVQRPVREFLPDFAGKTDPLIVRETYRAMGVDEDDLDRLVKRSVRRVGAEMAKLRHELAERGRVLPGVLDVLVALDDRAVLNTVLTGNIAVNAVLKLDTFRLVSYFDLEVGAFGSDSEDRAALPQIAIERANRMRQQWFGYDDDVWIIGDTPRDADVARANDLHCLLVATGGYHYDELSKLDVDMVVHDLTDTDQIVSLLTVT